MTLTPEALEEIKARVEAATRGPWLDMDGGGEISDRPAHVVTRADSGTPWFICDLQDDLGDPPEGWEDTSTGPGGCPVANAAFIAHARQDVPTLIKALEDRDAEIERLRPEVLSFAKLMEAALSAKDGVRGGNSWQKNTLALEILQHNLREKMDECEGKLKAAQCAANRGTEDGLFMADIETHRAADLAVHMGNFAMMIADICGALDRAAMDGGA